MNNIELINKKKKFSNITSHGDIIGNTNFKMVDSHTENKLQRPTKRVGFSNGLESKVSQQVGKRKISAPHEKSARGENTILNPIPQVVVYKKREYPSPSPRKLDSIRKQFNSSNATKDILTIDPTAPLSNVRTFKRMPSPRPLTRNILTGETQDANDQNGLGILPSVSLVKASNLRNNARVPKAYHSASNSGNFLYWEV